MVKINKSNMQIKDFIQVAKPGIVFSNLFTAFTGFFLASYGNFSFSLMVYSMVGLTLVLASSTVLNNYIDRDIDKLMERTSNRVSITGDISAKVLLYYSSVLGFFGFLVLWFFVNHITTILVIVGYIIYILLYSLWSKRKNRYSTFIGSFAGAMLPLAGYTSYSNNIDSFSIVLFLILLIWQMPHFYAIAIFRLQDYKNAGIPVMTVATSITNTKIHIFIWTLLFFIIILIPFILGFLGWLYLIVAIILSFSWVLIAYKGFKVVDDIKWSRKLFFFSIIILMVLFSTLMLDKVLMLV